MGPGRPSGAGCFTAGSCFFRAAAAPGIGGGAAAAVSKNVVFLGGFRRHIRQFFGSVLGPGRPSGAGCFPAGSSFFSMAAAPAIGGIAARKFVENVVFLEFQKTR